MINLGDFESCVCQRKGTPSTACEAILVLQEKGKKVTLRTRSGESAKLLILDACVLNNKLPKCDAVFLFEKRNKKYIILTELKGSDINHAFEQIKYTKEYRTVYKELIELLRENEKGTPIELAFVISNHKIDRVTHQKLELTHKIRVKQILHSEATSPMPDLRNWL